MTHQKFNFHILMHDKIRRITNSYCHPPHAATKSDAWLVVTHKCFNVEHKLFTPLYTPTTSLEEMSKIHNNEYLEQMFMIATRLKEMDLTLEETVTLASFNMLFPGTWLVLYCPTLTWPWPVLSNLTLI